MNEIELLKYHCNENIILVIEHMGLNLNDRGSYINGPCPVHGGNNPSGFSWLKSEGFWRCWTNNCHEEFGDDIIGLARGVMTLPYKEVCSFLRNLVNVEDSAIIREKIKNKKFVDKFKHTQISKDYHSEDYLQELEYHPYFLGRGFSSEAMNEFGIGFCNNENSQFYCRMVIPVRDRFGGIVGFTGRTIGTVREDNPKWKHYGTVNDHLFGLYKALPYIEEKEEVFLTEGPLGVIKLWQSGIKNCCACFGLQISQKQKRLLLESGAFSVKIAFDNDSAGEKAAEKLRKDLTNYFSCAIIELGKHKDIDEMNEYDIAELLNEQEKNTSF